MIHNQILTVKLMMLQYGIEHCQEMKSALYTIITMIFQMKLIYGQLVILQRPLLLHQRRLLIIG